MSAQGPPQSSGGPLRRSDAHRVEASAFTRQSLFHANLVLPKRPEVVLVEESLVVTETELRERHLSRVGRVPRSVGPWNAVVFAAQAETVEVNVSPAEDNLVSWRSARVLSLRTPEPSPNHRTDLADPDVCLIDQRACGRCHHRPSVSTSPPV